MESTASNIFVDSCQYTPVYFLENPSITQAKSYVVTQNISNIQKPVSDNLKRFYENSGKLENNLNITETNTKPRILKKHDNNVVGNNLKLASFLLPKAEPGNGTKQMTLQANNVVLNPVYIANTPNIVNTVPKLDVNSKIVQLKEIPNITRTSNGKIVPKIKPKETTTNSKHTSVQLLKLGETYHSLNQLSEEQMKIVNHALNIFNNPEKVPQKPTYDPVTNTKFIYKVISPKDVTLVGKNNLLLTQKKPVLKKIVKKIENKQQPESEMKSNKIPTFIENATTRSGRKVKISKNIISEEIPNKSKRKISNVAACHQCSTKFSSVHRLQRHYDFHPAHALERVHSNLFQCLLTIVKAGPKGNRANIFLDQLEKFINKLRSCIPCLVKAEKDRTDQSSLINDNISRLLGINTGKYNINIDGLECVKDQNGHCEHNPQHKINEPIIWINELSEVPKQIENSSTAMNGTEKLPSKRVEPRKHKSEHNPNPKKLKANPSDEVSSITSNDIVSLLSDSFKTENSPETNTKDIESCNDQKINNETNTVFERPKTNHIQFRSTHFDIRSSPIKPSTNTFSKFQINTEKMSKYKVHIIRPLQLNQLSNEIAPDSSNSLPIKQLFNKEDVEIKEQINSAIPKNWSDDQIDDLIKPNSLIEETVNVIQPNLIHVKDYSISEQNRDCESEISIPDQILTDQEHSIDALNFLESLGNECIYPETEIRNNSIDFHLDLFSFNNT